MALSNTHLAAARQGYLMNVTAEQLKLSPMEMRLITLLKGNGFKWGCDEENDIFYLVYKEPILPEKVLKAALIPVEILCKKQGLQFEQHRNFITIERTKDAFMLLAHKAQFKDN